MVHRGSFSYSWLVTTRIQNILRVRERQSYIGYERMKKDFPSEIEFMTRDPLTKIRTMTNDEIKTFLERLV